MCHNLVFFKSNIQLPGSALVPTLSESATFTVIILQLTSINSSLLYATT